MTTLLIATLLTAEPKLVTSEQFRERFASLGESRAALDARRKALPWLQASTSISTALVAAGVIWGSVLMANPRADSPLPLPAVIGASLFNLAAAIVFGAVSAQLEQSLDERANELEREAERLRAEARAAR